MTEQREPSIEWTGLTSTSEDTMEAVEGAADC